ncbi:PKD domain-containing protein [Chondrinema litorale]|uniref:PKD domain-containing protein n=1 Tax=Chondrinema litorale TaxID=2994555 RepID=UPI002543638B|nr:T9SS type A sorting domain-containing protein [Chondrinema litorale]UZR99155.1 T9SS type A sorting domain-containing protein [Chondrinema litorale]
MQQRITLLTSLCLFLISNFLLGHENENFTISNHSKNSSTTQLSAQKVSSFALINADTDLPIMEFGANESNITINLAELTTKNLSIRANTSPTIVGSVNFKLINTKTNNVHTRKESSAPYALYGDNNSDYSVWSPIPAAGDVYELTATPYTQSNLGGEVGTALTVTISFIEEADDKQDPIVTAYNRSVQLPQDTVILAASAYDPDGGSISYLWTLQTGPNTPDQTGASTSQLVLENLVAGTYKYIVKVTDDEGISTTKTVELVTAKEYTICEGDYTFTTQEEVNACNCNEITGSLIINGEDITSLSPLSSLTKLGSRLAVGRTSITSLDGLHNLTEYSIALSIGSNKNLTSLEAIKNVEKHSGNLYIELNPLLKNLDGLQFVTNVMRLQLNGNESLENIDALSNLVSLEYDVEITENPKLENLDGLKNARHLNKDILLRIFIEDNISLNMCCGVLDFINEDNVGAVIKNNAPSCNSPDELKSSCNNVFYSERIEAEDSYSILSDIGSNAIKTNENANMSNGKALLMNDKGDKVKINFNIASSGNYLLKVNLRSGHKYNSTAYWPSSYIFTLDGKTINLVGNTESVSTLLSSYGGSYFGNMESEELYLSTGNHYLTVEASASWEIVDYIEIESVGGAVEEPENNPPTDITISNNIIYTEYTGIVGVLSTIDADVNDTHTYELVEGDGDDDNIRFYITEDTLILNSMYFYNDANNATIRIQSTDDQGDSYEKSFQFQILVAPGKCYENVVLSSQAEVDNFSCTEIIGSLTISGNDITNLNNLQTLQDISNDLYIIDNPKLVNLKGLENLNSCVDIEIVNNVSLVSLEGFEVNSVYGNLKVNNNPKLVDISNLNFGLNTDYPTLQLIGNTSLESCCVISWIAKYSLSAYDNAPGCSSVSEIIDNCTESNYSQRIEVEDHFKVLNDVGSNKISALGNEYMSNEKAVSIFDEGDQIEVNFDVPEGGDYIIKIYVRSGNKYNSTSYWQGYNYKFYLNNRVINTYYNTESISPYLSSFGGSYFGIIETSEEYLGTGNNTLTIAAGSNWQLVDYIEISKVSASNTRIAQSDLVTEDNQSALSDDLVLYPNPTSGYLSISLQQEADQSANLKLLDSTGKEIFQKSYTSDINDILDISSYPKGYYILKIQSQNKILNKKIILN